MANSNDNDFLTEAAICTGALGVATVLGAAPLGIATGCGYLAWRLLQEKKDPNTVGVKYTPAAHRKEKGPGPKSKSPVPTSLPPGINF